MRPDTSTDPAEPDEPGPLQAKSALLGLSPSARAFGVHGMTGNVDEWVVNEKGKPHNSGLKGGYWSYVRGRCRPLTDGHAEDFRYYQIGFRCCVDPAASAPPTTPAQSTAAR